MRRRVGLVVVLLAVSGACSGGGEQGGTTSSPSPSPTGPRVLLFTKTAGFRHSSIPAAADAITKALPEAASALATSDARVFTDTGLSNHDVVVFLMTTGDVLDTAQQAAFERWIARGGGFAGVHSATDTEYGWAWYQRLTGATFKRHPRGTRSATLRIEDATHPSTRDVPSPWMRADEWYDFRANPRRAGGVHVLVTVDERTYVGGTMGRDHPIAWCSSYAGGRSWYTAMGHSGDAWKEPAFVAHVAAGILSVARAAPVTCP